MTQIQYIIGLGYKKQSGKSTAADYLADRLGCRVRPLSAKIYSIAAAIFGQPLEESDKKRELCNGLTGRQILQDIGSWLKDEFGRDFIVNSSAALQDIMAGKSVVIPDIRMEQEATMVHAYGGRLWQIQRNVCDINLSDKHATETEGAKLKWDKIIPNNGKISDLYRHLDNQLEQLRMEKNG